MYRILIADDEAWTRAGLRSVLDGNDLDVSVTAEAADGEEALQLYQELQPDIIITDIRMPGLDGLEFIQKVRERDSLRGSGRTKVIIISGYSDFHYAQQAIKLGADDYILKPIEDQALFEVIERCRNDLRTAAAEAAVNQTLLHQVHENLPLRREKFLINLIQGSYADESVILREAADLTLRLAGANYLCMVVQPAEAEPQAPTGSALQSFLPGLSQMIRERFGESNQSICFPGQAGEIILIVIAGSPETGVGAGPDTTVARQIAEAVKQRLGLPATIGIGRRYPNLPAVSVSYHEAKLALEYQTYLGKDRIYETGSIELPDIKPNYQAIKSVERLINHLKVGEKRQALQDLDAIIGEFRSANPPAALYPIHLKLLYLEIIHALLNLFPDTKNAAPEFSKYSLHLFEQLNQVQTVDQIAEWLHETVEWIVNLLAQQAVKGQKKVIAKALDYIQAHYQEPLTLRNLSEQVFLNESYFCKIFKEETGEAFTKYLIKLRIQKAQELLTDPTFKIYQIAEMVGYSDVCYFTKIFKDVVGVTPVQYREKI